MVQYWVFYQLPEVEQTRFQQPTRIQQPKGLPKWSEHYVKEVNPAHLAMPKF